MITETIRVLIADDHSLVREGLRCLLKSKDNYEVIGEAATGEKAVELTRELKPDILLLDVGFPSKSGLEVLYDIQSLTTKTTVIFVTRHLSESMAKQAFLAGAHGYLYKNLSFEQLDRAILKALKGEIVVSKELEHVKDEIIAILNNEAGARVSSDPLDSLSKREREIFFMLAKGMPNRVIAQDLEISPRTVETHRSRVIKKLNFASTADLVKFAIKNHLVVP